MSDFVDDPPSGMMSRWARVASQPGESYRWQCVDGRWIALSVGTGADLGVAFVSCSDGRRERGQSFDHALKLAKSWRT